MSVKLLFILYCTLCCSSLAQNYGEYARGAGQNRKGNRPVIAGAVAGTVFGGILGAWLGVKYCNKKRDKEMQSVRSLLQLQEDMFTNREKQWQSEYQNLFKAYGQLEKETFERDYEEFKAPDTDGDDMISRQEFNSYVKKYLASFPELSEKDFPKFDDFDLNADGMVSFEEWQKFLHQQKQQETKKTKEDGKGQDNIYSKLLESLYEQTSKSDGFNSLQKNTLGKGTKLK